MQQPPSDAGQALLDALIEAPLAWSSPAELARATGRGLEEVLDELAGLDSAGWLEGWERGAGADVVVTLSPWGAERLGVELIEVGHRELPRWQRPDAFAAAPIIRAPIDRFGRPDRRPHDPIDPNPTPPEVAELVEAAVLIAATNPRGLDKFEGLPRPAVYLAASLTPWPGPAECTGACPGCLRRRLRPWEYCLVCDRWGLDSLLGLDGGTGRARPRAARREAGNFEAQRRARKAKHRARLRDDRRRRPGEAA